MNAALGNVGKTVFYTDPIEADPKDQLDSLNDLVKDLDAGAVELLLILGGNPVFNSPVELGMRDRIQKAKTRVHLSLYEDETSAVCQWHLPEAHYLGVLGRCARVRRYGDHPAAADFTAVRGPFRLRTAGDPHRYARSQALRYRQRLLVYTASGCGFRGLVAAFGARWPGRRHSPSAEDSGGARRRDLRASAEA